MYRSFFIIPLLVAANVFSQIILSEVMYNPRGSETTNEFIELFNTSTTDTLSLAGWQIGDQDAKDNLISDVTGLHLPPRHYAVILDPDYFDQSNLYDSIIPADVLILTIDDKTFGSGGFTNSTSETITLVNADAIVIAEYTYPPNNADGISLEKINLSEDDSDTNWTSSVKLDGTPGFQNSVSPPPVDGKLIPGSLQFDPQQLQQGISMHVSVTVRNVGTAVLDTYAVEFTLSLNNFRTSIPLGHIFSEQALAVGDTALGELVTPPLTAGYFSLQAVLLSTNDANQLNDTLYVPIVVNLQRESIVINEIMYDPVTGEPEWLEIYNPQNFGVRLSDWMLEDEAGGEGVFPQDAFIAAGSYCVVTASDDLAFFYGLNDSLIVLVNKLPSLNNNEDEIVLLDFSGGVQDRVHYTEHWGGASGISLERINPQLAAQDSSNWNSCVDISGATPGRQNSIFTTIVPSVVTLHVSPNPFSPDADGVDDFAVVQIRLPVTTAAVNLKVYDVRGRLIRELLNNRSVGSNSEVIWDGSDNGNRLVRTGIYIIYLQAVKPEQGLLLSEKTTVVLARRMNQ